jgi:hypothetical protein
VSAVLLPTRTEERVLRLRAMMDQLIEQQATMPFATAIIREEGIVGIHCGFAHEADADTLARLTEARACAAAQRLVEPLVLPVKRRKRSCLGRPVGAGSRVAVMPLFLLDRDGVLVVNRPTNIKTPDQLTLIPGAVEAIARLKSAGVDVAICTNQRR